MLTLNYGETKQVPFKVRGEDLATSAPINPSAAVLTVGFVPAASGASAPTTWYGGSWDANVADNIYWGMCLVGPPPGVVNLARGTYVVWANFTVGVETIIAPVLDTLVVR